MKLLYCPKCHDLFNLTSKRKKYCSCPEKSGRVGGRYVTKRVDGRNIKRRYAEIVGNPISIVIAGSSWKEALLVMEEIRSTTDDKASREWYKRSAYLTAWVRPNSEPGNPHTKVVDQLPQ
jgi:hypothetical protein